MDKKTAELMRIKNALVKAYYSELDFEACKKTVLVTGNMKTEKTENGIESNVVVCGTALYPDFVDPNTKINSCSDAGSCKLTCIAFTGIANMIKSKGAELSNPDKASLRRLWLFNNKPEYFYKKLRLELEMLALDADKVYFREITSEVLDYSQFSDVCTIYGYFKNAEKISDLATWRYDAGLYSWNEFSTGEHMLDCRDNDIPIAAVIPKKFHNRIFKENNGQPIDLGVIVLHNGDGSDLQSVENYVEGKINLHLLSKKTSRGSKGIGNTRFLDSHKLLADAICKMDKGEFVSAAYAITMQQWYDFC